MAIFLGVLIQHGMEPGPMLLIEHQGIVFTLILALSASCVLATVMGLAVARQLALITLVDVHILVPAVVALSLVGVYALHNNIGDAITAFVFGGLGYLMIRFDYPRITMVIALVLGELAERGFHQSMMMADGALSVLFTRGISAVLFAITVLILVAPAARLLLERLRARARGAKPRRAAPMPAIRGRAARLVVPVLVLAVALVMLVWAYDYESRTRMVPVLTAWTLLIFALLDLAVATGTRPERFIAAVFAGAEAAPESDAGKPQPLRKVFTACAWVTGYLIAVLLAGFHVATPVYVALYVIVQGRMSLRKGLIAAAATAGFIAATFEWLMHFELYRGWLFG